MTGLETALATTGLKVLGEELIQWVRQRGNELSENDWAEMGLVISRKLEIDRRNIEASFLHNSQKHDIARRIESAGQIYRELAIVGEDEGFDQDLIDVYSELADICANWAIETRDLTKYWLSATDFFEVEAEYRELVD
ncbi:hypothetical protein OB919_18770 [Halobacteria archaeon AArc-curdl1]|uniref:Uncharacterized protein n=1 Tax=Natronosalvus hydrolyticus TaxID=2979988 RepID=A0AAP2ZBA6_9EURY|nr:hypothetical protein [Halobacteria archaeon AArc-curdl1]